MIHSGIFKANGLISFIFCGFYLMFIWVKWQFYVKLICHIVNRHIIVWTYLLSIRVNRVLRHQWENRADTYNTPCLLNYWWLKFSHDNNFNSANSKIRLFCTLYCPLTRAKQKEMFVEGAFPTLIFNRNYVFLTFIVVSIKENKWK